MRFLFISIAALATATTNSVPIATAQGLLRKRAQQTNVQKRILRTPHASECTILARSDLRLDGTENEDSFECVLDGADTSGVEGITLPIDLTENQKNELKEKMKTGELVSDLSTLLLEDGFKISEEAVHVPLSKVDLALGRKTNKHANRHLAIVTGNKPILAVKVFDINGLSRSESPKEISDIIFGTYGEPMNLKSQMSDCSFGQLNITAGLPVPDPNELAPGVVKVNIGISLVNNTRSAIRNAVTTALQNKLGHALPGPYHQVMYILEKCYIDCGWAAYAYINSWNSVYHDSYYKQVGVQMHGEFKKM